MDPKAYNYYQRLIPFSWHDLRPFQLNIRCSQLTKDQIAQIQHMVKRGKYSQADILAMGVSLLLRHMANPESIQLTEATPEQIESRSV